MIALWFYNIEGWIKHVSSPRQCNSRGLPKMHIFYHNAMIFIIMLFFTPLWRYAIALHNKTNEWKVCIFFNKHNFDSKHFQLFLIANPVLTTALDSYDMDLLKILFHLIGSDLEWHSFQWEIVSWGVIPIRNFII